MYIARDADAASYRHRAAGNVPAVAPRRTAGRDFRRACGGLRRAVRVQIADVCHYVYLRRRICGRPHICRRRRGAKRNDFLFVRIGNRFRRQSRAFSLNGEVFYKRHGSSVGRGGNAVVRIVRP